MAIRVDRDVLCFDKPFFDFLINLRSKKEASRYKITSQNRGYPCLLLKKGSLTVEASFSATAFFLALFSLLYLFQLLTGINQVQMSLGDAVWQYETLGTKLGTTEGILKHSCLIQWDEEKEICYVKRREEIPFIGGSLFGVRLYQQMKINSYQGRSMISGSKDKTEYVYIADYGKVYHKNRGCVYLNPSIRSLEYCRVAEQRNISGGKYQICKSCGKDVKYTDSMIVYITPYGDCFHSVSNCPGLKRSVRRVELSKTGNIPPCSKCKE